jgi:N-methylhydantoinase A
MTKQIVGADIGGTFTDLVLSDEDGRLFVDKRFSTVQDFSEGVVDSVRKLMDDSRGAATDVERIVHGTTVATNAILERQGARTALITTHGFRDVLEIGRLRVPKLYDIHWEKPVPLCPRHLRFEVRERMGADGQVVEPLDESSVREVLQAVSAARIESVAVCLINSYVNATHERRIRDMLHETMPGTDVSLSCDVLPEIKEFERTSTTVADAYIKPRFRHYLEGLRARLETAGMRCPVYIMQSNGGVQALRQTAERPVYAIESGPAAGVIAAQTLAERTGIPNALTFDMGGTTAKISIVEEGRVSYSSEFEVGGEISRNSRLIKGSGYILRTPVIDIAEVGAGGGSLAWIDAGGGLRVGPQGAGAMPGPACYGLGGAEPTVTDANVLLGYINPTGLAVGTVTIDREAARRAVATTVAERLGLDVQAAAYGIHEIANANMARAIRAVTTERGRDVRSYALVAFGGSGPIHAASLAREFEIPQVVVPPRPGVEGAARGRGARAARRARAERGGGGAVRRRDGRGVRDRDVRGPPVSRTGPRITDPGVQGRLDRRRRGPVRGGAQESVRA